MRKMRSRGGSPGRTTEVHTMKKWQIIVLVLAVAALAASGVINGMGDNRFQPKTAVTRAMLAQIIYNGKF